MRWIFTIVIFLTLYPLGIRAADISSAFDVPAGEECTQFGARGKTCNKDTSGTYTCLYPPNVTNKLICGKSALVQEEEAKRGILKTYPTVTPKLSVPIPTVKFTDILLPIYDRDTNKTNLQTIDVPFLAQYISGIYKYAVGFASVIAAVMMMIGGFQYMTAGGDQARVTAGKEKISNALIGLFLSLGTFLILTTVSPELVQLKALQIKIVKPEEFEVETDEPNDASDSVTSTQKICSSVEECKKKCEQYCKVSGNSHTCNHPDSKTAGVPLPSMGSVSATKSIRVSNELIAGLREVNGSIINLKVTGDLSEGDYFIGIASAVRSLNRQIELACDAIYFNKGVVPKTVAYPGGSNHGAGRAVDVILYKNNKPITCAGGKCCPKQSKSPFKEASILLDKIMTGAGWSRLENEMWHYELGNPGGNRCKYPNCPTPTPNCGK